MIYIRMLKCFLNKKGFTLVELVIVIAIIAVLSVISVLIVTEWIGKSRDTRRLGDLSQIEKGLEMVMMKNNEYPIPDNYVNVSASGSIIAYQGKFCDNAVIKTNFKNAPKDPLDDTCYTYYVTSDKKKYQIMGFLESYKKITLLHGNLSDELLAIDYSKRIPAVKGEKLGILILSGTNQPIEESGTGVDLVNTINNYIAYFTTNDKVSGSGNTLNSLKYGGELAYGLVGYRSFDDNTDALYVMGKIKNIYQKSTLLTSGVFLTGNGKIGNSIYMTGINNTGFVLSGGYDFEDFRNGFSLSVWSKNYKNNGEFLFSSPVFRYHLNKNKCFDIRGITHKIHQENLSTAGLSGDSGYFRTWLENCVGTINYDNSFHFHTFTFDNSQVSAYIDGKKIYNYGVSNLKNSIVIKNYNYYTGIILSDLLNKIQNSSIGEVNLNRVNHYITGYDYEKSTSFNNFDINLGKNSYMGYIDELRIYNRALSENDIISLYNATK